MKYLCLVAMLTGCAPASTIPADEEGVKFGQQTYVDGPTIMPTELLEDSRCPASSKCAWPGQVRIGIKWIRGNNDQSFDLTSGQPLQIADGALTLTEVAPIRQTRDKIALEDYRFKFSFAGGL